MTRRVGVLAFAPLLVTGSLLAQVPAGERFPITDPERLEMLGWPRDARNFFIRSKSDPATSQARLEAPETWGTGTGFSTVHAYELQPSLPSIRLSRSLANDTYCYDAGGTAPFARAQIQVPEGARLGSLRFWAYDSDGNRDLNVRLWETCQAYGLNPPINTLIGEASRPGAPGQYVAEDDIFAVIVSNEACAYSVEVWFAPPGQDCAFNSLRVQKLQLTWTREVSDAPAAATFSDVPTGHPFFQFVEALAKSGVTGGCQAAPPLYCPDEPLTRGQMAVFLSKALGLQWP